MELAEPANLIPSAVDSAGWSVPYLSLSRLKSVRDFTVVPMSTRGTLANTSSAMQPFQLFSCSGSGCAAMAEAAMQPWQKGQCSSGSSAAAAAQQVQLSGTSSAAICSNTGSDSLVALQPQPTTLQPQSTALQLQSTALQLQSTALQP